MRASSKRPASSTPTARMRASLKGPASSTPDARIQAGSKRPASSPAADVTPQDKRARRGRTPSEVITLDSDDDNIPDTVQRGSRLGWADADTEYIVYLSEPPQNVQGTPATRGATPSMGSSTSANSQPAKTTPRTPATSGSDLRAGYPSSAGSSSRKQTPPITASRWEALDASRRQSQPMSAASSPSLTSSAKASDTSTRPQAPRNIPHKPYSPSATDSVGPHSPISPKTHVMINANSAAHRQRNDVSPKALAIRPDPSGVSPEARLNRPVTPVMNSSASAGPRSPVTPNQSHNSSVRHSTGHQRPGQMTEGSRVKQAAKPVVGTALSGTDTTAKTVLSGSPQAAVDNHGRNSSTTSVPTLPQVATPNSVRPSEAQKRASSSKTAIKTISNESHSLASSRTGSSRFPNVSVHIGMVVQSVETSSTSKAPFATSASSQAASGRKANALQTHPPPQASSPLSAIRNTHQAVVSSVSTPRQAAALVTGGGAQSAAVGGNAAATPNRSLPPASQVVQAKNVAPAARIQSTGSVSSSARPSEAPGPSKLPMNRSPNSPLPPPIKPSSGSAVSVPTADGKHIQPLGMGRESGRGSAPSGPGQRTSAYQSQPEAGKAAVPSTSSSSQSTPVQATVPARPNMINGSKKDISPNAPARTSIAWSPQAILAKERQNRPKAVSKPTISSPLGVARPITRPSQGLQQESSPHIAHKTKLQDTPFATREEQSNPPKSPSVRFAVATNDSPEVTTAMGPLIENTPIPDPAAPAEDIWASETVFSRFSPLLQSFHDVQGESKIKVSKSRRLDVEEAVMKFIVGPNNIPGRIPYLWKSTFNPEYALYLLQVASYNPRKLKPPSAPKLPFLKRNIRAGVKGLAATHFSRNRRLAQVLEETTQYLDRTRQTRVSVIPKAEEWINIRNRTESLAQSSRCHRLLHLTITNFNLVESGSQARIDCADLPHPRAPYSGSVVVGRSAFTGLPFKVSHQSKRHEETGEWLNLIMPSRPISISVPLDLRNDINVRVRLSDLLDSEENKWPDPNTRVSWRGSIDVRHRLPGRVSPIEIPLTTKDQLSGVMATMVLCLQGTCYFDFDYSEPMAPLPKRIKPAKIVPDVRIAYTCAGTHEEMKDVGEDPPVVWHDITKGYRCAFCSLGQLDGEEELYTHYAVVHAGECRVDCLSREEIHGTLCLRLRIRHGEAMTPIPEAPVDEAFDLAMDMDLEPAGSSPLASSPPLQPKLDLLDGMDGHMDAPAYPDDPIMLANPFGLMQPQMVGRRNQYCQWSSRVVPGTVLDLLPELDKLYDGGRYHFYVRMVEEQNVLSRYHLTEKRRLLMCAWNRWRLEHGPLSLYDEDRVSYLKGWVAKYGSVLRRADLDSETKQHFLTLRTGDLITSQDLLEACKYYDAMAAADRYMRGQLNEDDKWLSEQIKSHWLGTQRTSVNRDVAGVADGQ